VIWHNLCLSNNCCIHSRRRKNNHETKYAWIRSTMIMSTKMWISFVINTISIHCYDDWRNGVERMCVHLCKTWNPTSLTMEVKKFQIASCVVVRSPPWAQWSRCIFIGSMAWPHMHRERPQAMGWRRPNLVHSVEEKMLKAILKDGMTRWAKN
jgi:hypothetical protein